MGSTIYWPALFKLYGFSKANNLKPHYRIQAIKHISTAALDSLLISPFLTPLMSWHCQWPAHKPWLVVVSWGCIVHCVGGKLRYFHYLAIVCSKRMANVSLDTVQTSGCIFNIHNSNGTLYWRVMIVEFQRRKLYMWHYKRTISICLCYGRAFLRGISSR